MAHQQAVFRTKPILALQVTADLSTAAVGSDTHQWPAQADHLPVIVIEGPVLGLSGRWRPQ